MSYFHGLNVKSSRGCLRRLPDITRLAVHYQRLTYVDLHACDSSLFGADYALPQLAAYYFYFINVFTRSCAVFGF